MDKTAYILKHLKIWQEEVYEDIEDSTDIIVFNTIGTIISLVSGGLMNTVKVHELITEVLNLSEEEQEKAFQVYSSAYDKAIKERYEYEEIQGNLSNEN
ncbi:MAG: hypothetical protein ABS939_08305 [Psychrobacillus sp.]